MNKRVFRKPYQSAESKKIVKENKQVEFPKTLNTYIGQKGYTILKSELPEHLHPILKEKLMAKPVVMGMAFGQAADTSFPIYRESANKIYMPRYFGEKEFGAPKSVELSDGEDIGLEFAGSLREIQRPVVEKYMDCVLKSGYGGGGLLELPCAFGKCLAKDTPLIMFDGSIKMSQDIHVDDLLMGDDSTPRRVLSLARGREMMYRVCAKRGHEEDAYVVNESHILSLIHEATGELRDISVKDYLKLSKREAMALKGFRVPVQFASKTLDIDPYTVGFWLGDEYNRSRISESILNDMRTARYLDEMGLKTSKYIPILYKCNSVLNRCKLLAGILDGCSRRDTYLVETINKTLINDVIYLARSLGIYVIRNDYLDMHGFHYQVLLYGSALYQVRNHCQYHRSIPVSRENLLLYTLDVKKVQVDDYYGFEIDGNRRFILGDFSVTHNTVLSLNIIAQLKKKTLVIVNKEFLMNQWIERIGEFLPNARIGRIQGPVIDIENKDIVLGMLQSISQKDYPSSTFASFGLTIIDEVHHISSEVFSRALFKIVSKYMLGLSATMERKDGTTDVFKLFLGDVAFKGDREEEHPVCVRAIEYVTNDSAFNETEYDFRGNPKYSTMIVKLCEYNRRSDFIVKVVEDLFHEHPKGQVMILAHNRSLLTYLHDAIQHRGFATVGYYVGGMKEANLKETEGKQVVIATYAMAAEALDIKTLTTLVMATPKTDIVQSVGRILRSKHSNPIVVDIVDKHDVFQKQWVQRRRFYKKCNYRIRMITSTKYKNMQLDWDRDDTWTRVFEPKNFKKNACEASVEDESEDTDGEEKVPAKKCMVMLDMDSPLLA